MASGGRGQESGMSVFPSEVTLLASNTQLLFHPAQFAIPTALPHFKHPNRSHTETHTQ